MKVGKPDHYTFADIEQEYEQGTREGFAAGIEAAAKKVELIGARYHSGQDVPAAIRALRPPAAPAESEGQVCSEPDNDCSCPPGYCAKPMSASAPGRAGAQPSENDLAMHKWPRWYTFALALCWLILIAVYAERISKYGLWWVWCPFTGSC